MEDAFAALGFIMIAQSPVTSTRSRGSAWIPLPEWESSNSRGVFSMDWVKSVPTVEVNSVAPPAILSRWGKSPLTRRLLLDTDLIDALFRYNFTDGWGSSPLR
jgi:hypothetical protein